MGEKSTDRRIESLRAPERGDVFAWDTVPGFGLRCGRQRKTFVVQYRLRGRQRRLVLGHWPHRSLAAARAMATEVLAGRSGRRSGR